MKKKVNTNSRAVDIVNRIAKALGEMQLMPCTGLTVEQIVEMDRAVICRMDSPGGTVQGLTGLAKEQKQMNEPLQLPELTWEGGAE